MPESGRAPISGCVISYQESDRIADCVRSLSFCDEVIVVDSGSTDGTQAIAEELGARVIENIPFPGHRQQKQFAIEQAQHDLVFCLDADERCTITKEVSHRKIALATAAAAAPDEDDESDSVSGTPAANADDSRDKTTPAATANATEAEAATVDEAHTSCPSGGRNASSDDDTSSNGNCAERLGRQVRTTESFRQREVHYGHKPR